MMSELIKTCECFTWARFSDGSDIHHSNCAQHPLRLSLEAVKIEYRDEKEKRKQWQRRCLAAEKLVDFMPWGDDHEVNLDDYRDWAKIKAEMEGE
jgi:hypothetical protein